MTKLEEILEEKQKVKRAAIDKIAKNFKVYDLIKPWDSYRSTTLKVINLGKNLLATWNSKIEYVKFKKVLSIARKMQFQFRMLKSKRMIRYYKFCSMIIGRSYKLSKIRATLFSAKRIVVTLQKCARKVMFRYFQLKMRRSKIEMENIFEKAWNVIETRMKIKASEEIQRIYRGFISRVQSADEVQRLQVIKKEVKRNRAATAIQKISRGFLVRTRLDRLQRAAGFIQGYTRMLWLSKYFQLIKKNVRKIQTFVRKYLIKNKKVKEKMESFLCHPNSTSDTCGQ
jgi:hypothetical protein